MNRTLALAITLALTQTVAVAQAVPDRAAGWARTIQPYVEAESLGVIRVDPKRVDLDAFWTMAEAASGAPKDEHPFAEFRAISGKWLADMIQAGGSEVYFVINLTDQPWVYAVVPAGNGDCWFGCAAPTGREPCNETPR